MDLMAIIKGRAQYNYRSKSVRIGIGLSNNVGAIEKCVRVANAQKIAEVIVYKDSEIMLSELKAGNLDGVVRGSLPARDTLQNLQSIFKLEFLLRLACIKLPSANKFIFIAPVGIDEGITRQQKMEFIVQGHGFLKRIGIEPRVGILSGGRPDDKGRLPEIDASIEMAEELTELASSKKINAKHYGILIETAVRSCNLILLPDGVAGNLVFRTLYYLTGAEAIGAPLLNLDRIYIDTSRTKRSYVDAITLAGALAE